MSLEVIIAEDGISLFGTMSIPSNPIGWVIFAHGSGSSRKSTRNVWVASKLNEVGYATLLFDLLTPEEDLTYANRFNIPLLAHRLHNTTRWLVSSSHYMTGLPIGLFGASTGAAAALMSLSLSEDWEFPIKAAVSRGGRADLVGQRQLSRIKVPTLLIVGSLDDDVIMLNKQAKASLTNSELRLVDGATHLFEEPGTLDEVVELTTNWFQQYLVKGYPNFLQT